MTEADILAAVRAADARRCQAMLEGDVAALDQMLSERLSYTHSDASVDTKQSYLEKVARRYFDYRELTIEDDHTIVAGDCVIIVGRMTGRVVIEKTKERFLNNRTLSVWARENDTWRFVAFQPTPFLMTA